MTLTRTILAALVPAALLSAAPSFAAEVCAPVALTEAQREEVRTLVQEVLADADRRGSFADGVTAGIDKEGKIFLKSEDEKFNMNIKGRIQFRYMYNNQQDRNGPVGSNNNESEDGFQLRRVKLEFFGYVGDPRFSYLMMLATSRSTELVSMEEASVSYDLDDTLKVTAGKMKQPFAREELISSGKQVAVERGLVTEAFTLNRGEGVQLQYHEDQVKARVMLHSGGNSESVDAYNNTADYAAVGRLDFLALGSGKDVETDFALLDARKQALSFGAAYDYEKKNADAVAVPTASEPPAVMPTNVNNVHTATLDAVYKVGGVALSAAVFNSWADRQGAGYANRNLHSWGAVGTVDVRVSQAMDVYARYEMIDDDDMGDAAGSVMGNHGLQAVTLGANYFFTPKVKLTGDVVYVYNSDVVGTVKGPLNSGVYSSGLGMIGGANDDNNQVVARLQLQLEF